MAQIPPEFLGTELTKDVEATVMGYDDSADFADAADFCRVIL